ncbi:MAG TPA: PPOX class F420-dependent oxidoreductase [Acidimicrobiales bacterium]|nr:PPOX class F420-dependent oxidoreductase [Acidimicrobiales bacterium]
MNELQHFPEPDKTTVTSTNSMPTDQLVRFMGETHVARLGTINSDGWPHVTPVWYVWEGEGALIILGESRRHLRNLQRDPRVTLCVDEDYRIARGFSAGAQAVVIRGTAAIDHDGERLQAVYAKEAERYLGPEGAQDPAYVAAVASERRVLVVLTPVHIVSWDFT